MNLCDRDRCTLCGACVSACPKHCIKFKTDEYGFVYPQIDEEVCIDCGKCNRVCHMLNDLDYYYPQKAYAVWSNDDNDRKTSTSGGAASVFYQTVIENCGVCYGAVFDDSLNVVIEGYCDENILKFKNSKYVHSYMNDTFYKIKDDLYSNKKVIFIGLPCQVASIKSFLKKDFENLILVDIVCHGTPPTKYLRDHIEYVNKKFNKRTSGIKFREDNDFKFLCFENENNKPFYRMTKNADSYLLSFFEALTYKESCYQCKYAQNNRVSDITIGDFWGLGQEIPFDHPYTGAISLVLINTEKGKEFFELTKRKLFFEERPVTEGINGNDQLNRPSTRNENRDKFLKLYSEKGFEQAVNAIYGDYMLAQKKLYQKQQIKFKFRKFVKKILLRK